MFELFHFVFKHEVKHAFMNAQNSAGNSMAMAHSGDSIKELKLGRAHQRLLYGVADANTNTPSAILRSCCETKIR